MLPLGTPAPDFSLPDTDGRTVRLGDFDDAPALLVAFICNHCPYVKHLQAAFAALAREYIDRGVGVVAISANDASTHPADGPEQMAAEKARVGYPFPYLYDESQAVARAYGAVCTPDFFLFDGDRRLVYRGRFDASSPGRSEPVTGEDLREALDAVLKGHEPSGEQIPSVGCSIKWKPGSAPV
jgi:peroxiredoxin